MWTKRVKVGEFVKVIDIHNKLSLERILPITKSTKNSIFIDKMQFSKHTGLQSNMKRKLEPLLLSQKEIVKMEETV